VYDCLKTPCSYAHITKPMPGTSAHEARSALALLLSMFDGTCSESRLLNSWALCHSCILHVQRRSNESSSASSCKRRPSLRALHTVCKPRNLHGACLTLAGRRMHAVRSASTMRRPADSLMPASRQAPTDWEGRVWAGAAAAPGRTAQRQARGLPKPAPPLAAHAAHAPGTPVSADGWTGRLRQPAPVGCCSAERAWLRYR